MIAAALTSRFCARASAYDALEVRGALKMCRPRQASDDNEASYQMIMYWHRQHAALLSARVLGSSAPLRISSATQRAARILRVRSRSKALYEEQSVRRPRVTGAGFLKIEAPILSPDLVLVERHHIRLQSGSEELVWTLEPLQKPV